MLSHTRGLRGTGSRTRDTGWPYSRARARNPDVRLDLELDDADLPGSPFALIVAC